MGSILELFYGVIFQPKQTMERIAREQPLGSSVLTYLLITAATGGVALAFWDPSEMEGAYQLSPQFFDLMPKLMNYGLVLSLVFSIVVFLLTGAVFHLIAELMGGKGSVTSLLSVLGFAALPQLLNLPLTVIFGLLDLPFGGILTFAFFIWTVVLRVIGVEKVYGLTPGKSTLVVLAPLLVVIVLTIFAVVLFMITVGPAIMEMMPTFGNLPSF
jgi:hypothetical protein